MCGIAALSPPVLAAWECLIGLALITGQFMRVTLVLVFMHMSRTITPLFLFPHETWLHFPYAATLEGQYIIKNLVLVTAGLVIYGVVHAGSPIEARGRRLLRFRLGVPFTESQPSDAMTES